MPGAAAIQKHQYVSGECASKNFWQLGLINWKSQHKFNCLKFSLEKRGSRRLQFHRRRTWLEEKGSVIYLWKHCMLWRHKSTEGWKNKNINIFSSCKEEFTSAIVLLWNFLRSSYSWMFRYTVLSPYRFVRELFFQSLNTEIIQC